MGCEGRGVEEVRKTDLEKQLKCYIDTFDCRQEFQYCITLLHSSKYTRLNPFSISYKLRTCSFIEFEPIAGVFAL